LEQLNPGDSINITITPFIRTTVDDKQYEIIYNNYIEQLDIA
jgi:hypothetical protein